MKKPQAVEPRPCECGDHAWSPLTRGYITLVSPEDADLLRVKWHAHKTSNAFYAFRTIHIVGSWQPGLSGKRISEYLHRLVNPSSLVDHKNHNTLDNRRTNLRAVTAVQSVANTRKSTINFTSKYKGVCWDSRRQKWLAQIDSKFIGRFNSEKDAALAYDVAAVRAYGEYAQTNGIVLHTAGSATGDEPVTLHPLLFGGPRPASVVNRDRPWPTYAPVNP